MNCQEVVKGEITQKYLLGQLTEAEQEAFEEHYFECPRCFAELQTYRGLQTELRRAAPVIQRERVMRRVWWPWVWAPAAAIVVIAVGLGLRLHRPVSETLPSLNTGARQPRTTQPAPPAVPSLSELANIQPPPYSPVTLRGTQDEATLRFHVAMRQYVKGDYGAAIPVLSEAAKLNPRAADVSFFLGICYLLRDQTDSAITQLRSTATLGDSPYLEDAHFYLAEAYLREGNLDAAQTELNKTIELRGDREGEARRLLNQLQRLRNTTR